MASLLLEILPPLLKSDMVFLHLFTFDASLQEEIGHARISRSGNKKINSDIFKVRFWTIDLIIVIIITTTITVIITMVIIIIITTGIIIIIIIIILLLL